MDVTINNVRIEDGKILKGDINIVNDSPENPMIPNANESFPGEYSGLEFISGPYFIDTVVNKIEIISSNVNNFELDIDGNTFSTPIVSNSITPKLKIKIFGSSTKVEKVITLQDTYKSAVYYLADDEKVIAGEKQVGELKTSAINAKFSDVVTNLDSELFELILITDYELTGYYESRTATVAKEGNNLKVIFDDIINQELVYEIESQPLDPNSLVDYPEGADWKHYSSFPAIINSKLNLTGSIICDNKSEVLIPLDVIGDKDAVFKITGLSFDNGLYHIETQGFGEIEYKYVVSDSIIDYMLISGPSGFSKGSTESYRVDVYFSRGQGPTITKDLFEWVLETGYTNSSLVDLSSSEKLSRNLVVEPGESASQLRLTVRYNQSPYKETTKTISVIIPTPSIPNFHGTTSGITSYSTFTKFEADLQNIIDGVETEIENYRVDYRTNIKPLLDQAATQLWGPDGDGTGISGLVFDLIENETADDAAFDKLKSDVSGYLWDYRKPDGIKEQLDKAVVDVYGVNGISGKVFNLEEELEINWEE